MIDFIHLKNFQGHEDSRLELCPGINAIIGKSDNGKSSIVRALNYVRYNRPASNNYPSHWIKNGKGNLTGEMSITIGKQGKTLTRFRNKDENGYKIDSEILKAINRDVPEQVETFLNLSEVNLQKQLDSHFLLADTPGQVAQFFNELVKMDEIDLYLSEALSMKTKNNKDIRELTELKERQEQELENYSWIEKAEKYNKALAGIETDIEEIEEQISAIEKSLKRHIEYVEALNILPDFKKAETIISEIEKLPIPDYSEIKRLSGALVSFEEITEELETISDISAAEKLIAEIEKQPVIDDSEIIELEEELVEYKNINVLLQKLSDIEEAGDIISKIEKYNKRISEYDIEIGSLKVNLTNYNRYVQSELEILNRIAEIEQSMPNICPLCGNTLHQEVCQ